MSKEWLSILLLSDGGDYPATLNRLAVVAFVVAGAVGVLGLFALPTLESMGLSFREAFAIIGVTEFAAAVVAGLAAYHLYAVPEESG